MMPSKRKNVLIFVVAAGLGLPVAYFFAKPFEFWMLVVLYGLTAIGWCGLALVHRLNTARFGAPMTFDEIVREQDRTRMVPLIRYHLGWSPGKIADELNRLGIRNHGLPWRENDVRQAVKKVRRVF